MREYYIYIENLEGNSREIIFKGTFEELSIHLKNYEWRGLNIEISYFTS